VEDEYSVSLEKNVDQALVKLMVHKGRKKVKLFWLQETKWKVERFPKKRLVAILGPFFQLGPNV